MKEYLYNCGDETCSINVLHQQSIKHAKEVMLDDETCLDLSEVFKMFADPTRLKILSILLEDELCVCDIGEVLSMSQSAVSHQLQTLRSKNLVKYRREGRQSIYSIADSHVKKIIEIGVEHVYE